MPRWFSWRRRLSSRRTDGFPAHPAALVDAPELAPGGRFTPRPVNEAEVRAEIQNLAGGLAPDAVDEATGHPLDNLINAYAELWGSQLRAEYAAYCVNTAARIDRAKAELEALWLLEQVDRRRLMETEAARDAALYRLGGHRPALAENEAAEQAPDESAEGEAHG